MMTMALVLVTATFANASDDVHDCAGSGADATDRIHSDDPQLPYPLTLFGGRKRK
jgi:hypothetical protein